MILYFADVMPDGKVRACLSCDAPEVGPPVVQNVEGTPLLLDGPIDWSGPTPTSELHIINGEHVWLETASLEDLKAAKNSEINQWRAKANFTSFPFQGKLIACDSLSRSDIDAVANYIGLFGTFPPDFPMAWKATDNEYVMLPDVESFKAMYTAMTAQGTLNFLKSQNLKSYLNAATTAEEICGITWQRSTE